PPSTAPTNAIGTSTDSRCEDEAARTRAHAADMLVMIVLFFFCRFYFRPGGAKIEPTKGKKSVVCVSPTIPTWRHPPPVTRHSIWSLDPTSSGPGLNQSNHANAPKRLGKNTVALLLLVFVSRVFDATDAVFLI